MKLTITFASTLFLTGAILSASTKAAELTPLTAMKAFDAKGEKEFTTQKIASFKRSFESVDGNKNGFLTEKEYISNSPHFRGHKAGARGFLFASDNDGDGRVSKVEYVMNRIVTDEAKEIYTRIDPNTDWKSIPVFQWKMKRIAFEQSAYFSNRTIATQIFARMDANKDGVLHLPEYLRVYGPWARAGLPKEAIDGIK